MSLSTFTVMSPRVRHELWAVSAGWRRIANAIGNFQARVLLTALYLVLVAPIGLLLRLFADPLRLAQHSESYWVPVDQPPLRDVEQARRQS